jgi:two-component system, response regulator PdtaR
VNIIPAKILVVEDDGISASVLRMKLENWGYESPVAFTSQDAIRQFQKTEPDLVIMDIALKGKLNGIETAAIIDSELKTPIIYYSSKNDKELSEKIKKLQNRDYITKTSGDEQLKLSIQKSLEKNFLELDETELLVNNNEILSTMVKPEIEDIITTQGDEDLNGNISTGEKDKIIRKVETFQNKGYLKLKPEGDNLKPVIEENHKENGLKDSFISEVPATKNDLDISENVNDEYHQSYQNIKHELKKLDTHFSEVFDKASSQEKEIKTLNQSLEEYITLINEKDNTIKDMEKTQQRLEEEVINYKNQHQNVLNEIYSLKNQINTFVSNLND